MYRWTLYSIAAVVVVATSYGALREEIYTVGILNVVGLVLFAVGASGLNKYTNAPTKLRRHAASAIDDAAWRGYCIRSPKWGTTSTQCSPRK